MYYYYIYAYKGDIMIKEFVAYKSKRTIREKFKELESEDYDCIVIDDISKEEYMAQIDPYGTSED